MTGNPEINPTGWKTRLSEFDPLLAFRNATGLMSATNCSGPQVSRRWADRAYVGTAYLGEVGDDDYCNCWYGGIRRGCGRGGGCASAGEGGDIDGDYASGRGGHREDFRRGARSATGDCSAGAIVAE